jgi:arylsulfatase A
MPHVLLFRSKAFEHHSTSGLYGDVIEELDDTVGRILAELSLLNLAYNTLVVFTSDNGPWLKYKTLGRSAGLLRDGKSSVWEGGMRVPALFWGPGIVHDIGSTLDFMATFAALSNAELPASQPVLDSLNLMPVLARGEKGPRDEFFLFRRSVGRG